VGLTETDAKAQGIQVKKGLFPWAVSGRATSNGRTQGLTKLLFDDSPEAVFDGAHAGRVHGKILGGGIVGPNAGDMLGEIALVIVMGADAEAHAHFECACALPCLRGRSRVGGGGR